MFKESKKLRIKTLVKYLSFLIFTLITVSCNREMQKGKVDKNEGGISMYDSAKAEKWGADKYGMKKYVFAFLKRGSYKEKDSVKAAELQSAHLKNINRMAEEGKLVLAGPFMDNDDLRGIYIFNVQSVKEAEDLTNTDPAIQAGVLKMELKSWYGSAALMGLNEWHTAVARENP
jgi:uncharacterized protein YciI